MTDNTIQAENSTTASELEVEHHSAKQAKHRTPTGGQKDSVDEVQALKPHILIMNAVLLLACGIGLYSVSGDSNFVAFLAILTGILASIPSLVSLTRTRNVFSAYLLPVNKLALFILALIPVWHLNGFLLDNIDIPVLQHLVSLCLIMALCCLIIYLERRQADYDKSSLNQHLALRALDNANWIYSISIGIVLAVLTCLMVRVIAPDSFFAEKLLSRGIIPPITLLLFFSGLTDLSFRFWMLWRQLQQKESALLLLVTRINKRNREDVMESLYTSMDRAGELNRYLVWAIPILGFIGTVLGISLAAQGMGSMLTSASQEYSEVLTKALEPLGIAFDTTLVALTLALFLALAQSLHSTWQDRHIGRIIDSHSPKA